MTFNLITSLRHLCRRFPWISSVVYALFLRYETTIYCVDDNNADLAVFDDIGRSILDFFCCVTMCPPGCHHNYFMATPELGHRMYGYTLYGRIAFLLWSDEIANSEQCIAQIVNFPPKKTK